MRRRDRWKAPKEMAPTQFPAREKTKELDSGLTRAIRRVSRPHGLLLSRRV